PSSSMKLIGSSGSAGPAPAPAPGPAPAPAGAVSDLVDPDRVSALKALRLLRLRLLWIATALPGEPLTTMCKDGHVAVGVGVIGGVTVFVGVIVIVGVLVCVLVGVKVGGQAAITTTLPSMDGW